MEVIRRVFTDNELSLEVKKGQRVIGDVHLGVDFRHDPSQAEMLTDGTASEIAVVDTTSANNDYFGSVRMWNGHGLFSKRYGRDRISLDTRNATLSGICENQVGSNAWGLLNQARNEDGTYDMVKFRLSVLGSIASEDLKGNIKTYSDLWREEKDIARAMAQVVAKNNGFRRLYQNHKVIKLENGIDQMGILEDLGMYYEGDSCSGLLTTTQQLFAVFAVRAAMQGQEEALFRLCIASMDYVGSSFMGEIGDLADRTLAELGRNGSNTRLILVDRNGAALTTDDSKNIYQMLKETTL